MFDISAEWHRATISSGMQAIGVRVYPKSPTQDLPMICF
jgi:hypothetical protein